MIVKTTTNSLMEEDKEEEEEEEEVTEAIVVIGEKAVANVVAMVVVEAIMHCAMWVWCYGRRLTLDASSQVMVMVIDRHFLSALPLVCLAACMFFCLSACLLGMFFHLSGCLVG